MKRALTLISICVVWCSLLQAQIQRSPEVTAGELLSHIRYLASDQLEGRKAGSKGAKLAAQYIAAEFKSYGLQTVSAGKNYVQPFEIVTGVEAGKGNLLKSGKTSWKMDKDFRPLGFSSSGSFMGDVVFAGYGITNPDKNYDDYAGLDVKDKAVVVLRNSPDGDNPHGDFAQQSSLRYKASKAKEMGARALLVVTGPSDEEDDNLIKLRYDHNYGNAGLLAVSVSRAVVNDLIKERKTTLKELQQSINGSKSPMSFALEEVSLSLSVDLKENREVTENVVGYLEGADPLLKKEFVVIGAHYDHLGYGGEGSGSLKPDTTAIHNGADDNASGTAGVLELAQAFSARQKDLKRSLLFLAFSGEELGLLGSAYYVKHPVVPLEQTVAMINMDMIGRMRDRKLIVYGIGTSPGFEALVQKYNNGEFDLKLNKDGFGPSDHSSFYGAKIPVFHFFTDLHEDYHRPSDDTERIRSDEMQQVVRLIDTIALDLAGEPTRPEYMMVEPPRQMGEGRGFRTYVGTIPDYSEQANGMRLSGVREGSPAAKAGLQAGDVMIKFGKVDIKNVYDYTYALGAYKPGDEVEVTVMRGDKRVTCVVNLEKRN